MSFLIFRFDSVPSSRIKLPVTPNGLETREDSHRILRHHSKKVASSFYGTRQSKRMRDSNQDALLMISDFPAIHSLSEPRKAKGELPAPPARSI